MRLSWYADTGVAVFSIWQGGMCTGTFRLPIADLPRMVATLSSGPGASAVGGAQAAQPWQPGEPEPYATRQSQLTAGYRDPQAHDYQQEYPRDLAGEDYRGAVSDPGYHGAVSDPGYHGAVSDADYQGPVPDADYRRSELDADYRRADPATDYRRGDGPPGYSAQRTRSGYQDRPAAAYPDGPAYPDTAAAYPDTAAAYPDTAAAYPDTAAAYPDTAAAYPDTAAAYPDAHAYPDDPAYPDGGAYREGPAYQASRDHAAGTRPAGRRDGPDPESYPDPAGSAGYPAGAPARHAEDGRHSGSPSRPAADSYQGAASPPDFPSVPSGRGSRHARGRRPDDSGAAGRDNGIGDAEPGQDAGSEESFRYSLPPGNAGIPRQRGAARTPLR